MIQYKKILMTLALLLTAVTGAWADETLLLTIESKDYTSFKSGSKTFDDMVTVTFSNSVDNNGNEWGWYSTGASLLTVAGTNGYTITSCKFYTYNGPAKTGYTVEGESPSVYIYNGNVYTDDSKSVSIGTFGVTKIEVYTSDPDAIEVTPGSSANTWTFTMPGSDVVLTPQYAPVAKWAVSSEVDQIPTAIDGIIAGEAKAIVNEGTVAKAGSTENAQGTVMYLTTTDANMTKEQARDAVTGWTSTVPTGAVLTGSYAEDQTVYVWYYIKGIDAAGGVTPTAENTFNDSEICTTPLTVTLKANQFTLTLDPAPVKNMTVTAGTETKTPTTEGKTDIKMNSEVKLKANEGYKFRKVEVKKGAPDVKIESFSIYTSSNYVSSGGTFTCSIIDILPANATNQTFEWNINSGAPAGTTIKTVSDDTKTVTILAGANSGSFTIEATAKDGGGANKLMHITVME